MLAVLPSFIVATIASTVPPTVEAGDFKLEFSGRVEAAYSFAFQAPANGISNYRIFDNRHNSFSISAVGLGFQASYLDAYAKIALWWGLTPTTIYGGEPTAAQAGVVGPSDAVVWRMIQEAYAGYTIAIGRGLSVEAGIFLSSIGIEGVRVQDNWHWSSSNLNFGFPFYHAGVRASYSLSDAFGLTFGVLNGFSGIVDSNDEKSLVLIANGSHGDLEYALLYHTGVERPEGSIEGSPWLHLFDFWLRYQVTEWMQVALQLDAGFEPNEFGTTNWQAMAGYLRFPVSDYFAVAVRGDYFREHKGQDGTGQASGLFVPVDWVASGVVTLEATPLKYVIVRLEYRHDEAGQALYFDDDLTAPERTSQDAVTLGMSVFL